MSRRLLAVLVALPLLLGACDTVPSSVQAPATSVAPTPFVPPPTSFAPDPTPTEETTTEEPDADETTEDLPAACQPEIAFTSVAVISDSYALVVASRGQDDQLKYVKDFFRYTRDFARDVRDCDDFAVPAAGLAFTAALINADAVIGGEASKANLKKAKGDGNKLVKLTGNKHKFGYDMYGG